MDSESLLGATGITLVLLAFVAFPLLRPRWYARLVALVPLSLLGVVGVFIFGPLYVPATLAMLVAALLPDGEGEEPE